METAATSGALLGGLLLLLGSAIVAGREPLFQETFDTDITEIGRHFQYETGLILKHGGQYPGWTKQGKMPVHFVLQGPNDWALMLFSNAPGENLLTLNESFAANEQGKQYTISVDVGPGVYAGGSQATQEGDRLLLELLRDDGSVLRSFPILPRKWDKWPAYANTMFTYEGDGAGRFDFGSLRKGLTDASMVRSISSKCSARPTKRSRLLRIDWHSRENARRLSKASVPFNVIGYSKPTINRQPSAFGRKSTGAVNLHRDLWARRTN